MPCDTKLKARQTIKERAEEVRAVAAKVVAGLAAGRIKPKVGPTGGVAFLGVSEAERDGVTDACMYRRVMASGNALARMALQRAETLAGRQVDRQAVAHGHHSHDGGATWHHHKG
jgi:hypothetical protein